MSNDDLNLSESITIFPIDNSDKLLAKAVTKFYENTISDFLLFYIKFIGSF